MKKIILLAISILMLCGCEDNSRKCIKSHTELRIMFLPSSNGQLKQVMMPYAVCDEWEGN